MAPKYRNLNWEDYGRRKDFWVRSLLQRVHALDCDPGEIRGVITTNARFEHELEPLKSMGFRHYMVCCSEGTRRERLEKAGHKYNAMEQNDASEQCARAWRQRPPEGLMFVWNDSRPSTAEDGLLGLNGSVISAETFVKSHQHELLHSIPGIPLRLGVLKTESAILA